MVAAFPDIRSALSFCTDALQKAGIEQPRRESSLLLGHVLERSPGYLLAHPEMLLGEMVAAAFEASIRRRSLREPLAYVTGTTDWLDFSLSVTRAALIPRPETELLAERAISATRERCLHGVTTVVDLGTGSGAIAIAVARTCPVARVTGIDISAAALRLARKNSVALQCADVQFMQCDLLNDFAETIDVLVANLPYIPTDQIAELEPELAYEPLTALDGGVDGLQPFRVLFTQAPQRLRAGGVILLECGHDQAVAVALLARAVWPEALIRTHRDYANIERFVEIDTSKSTSGLWPAR